MVREFTCTVVTPFAPSKERVVYFNCLLHTQYSTFYAVSDQTLTSFGIVMQVHDIYYGGQLCLSIVVFSC